jgi:hypothetical protein
MHVKPRAINYSPGTRAFSFEIFISDLPRDKEDKTGYQAESITDCSLIFQDLINEIHLGQMFGDDVLLTRPVNSEPFVEQYTHTLTGVTGIIELSMDYDWSACSIPASWNYNTPTNSNSSGFGSLQFIESLEQNGVFVSLDNDLEAPGNSYYYGTNGAGVKGWYASQAGTVTSVGLTAGTGISVSGGPITSSGSITVTNSAPDQVVALTAGTGITTSGTYPNFTITNSAPSSGGTVTSVAALTLGTTGTDLSSTVATSTTTPVITLNVPTASAANRGALSSADWATFNSKLSGLTVGTTAIASGTVGRVLFEGAGNVLQESANLFWNNTNSRLGINTSSPEATLSIKTSTTLTKYIEVAYSAALGANYIESLDRVSGNAPLLFYAAQGTAYIGFTAGSTGGEKLRIHPTGNVSIGGTVSTDAGYKLDVNGTARVKGASNVGTTTALTVINSDSTTLLQVQDNGYIRVGSQATSAFRIYATDTSGDSEPSGLHLVLNSRVVSSATPAGIGMVMINGINGTATTGTQNVFLISKGFAPTSGTATYATTSIIPTINQTGGANGITRGLYVNPTLTAAADFRAIEVASGTTVLAPSVTARASLRIPSGTAPTSPVNGDIWFDGTDIKMRIGGVTKTFTLI